MIKKIIHCGDIHIRPQMRHDEYAVVFDRFIEMCAKIAEPYEYDEVRIVVTGDLVHSKTEISNDMMVFASKFLRSLSDIAKVIVIAGNHDLIKDNKTKTDTLTGIFETADFDVDRCVFLDSMLDYESGCVVDDNITWVLYSIFDDFRTPFVSDIRDAHPENKFIGLFHETVAGSTNENGYSGDGYDGDMFRVCDYVMAGHIHKRQVLRRNGVEIVYPGSLIQQTFGEAITQHGFSILDVETMKTEFYDIENEFSLFKVEIDSVEDIKNDKERLVNF